MFNKYIDAIIEGVLTFSIVGAFVLIPLTITIWCIKKIMEMVGLI